METPAIYFITGISTEVGKTVVAAVFTEALRADYWKPVQAGDLHYTDTDKVSAWVKNKNSMFHNEAFALSQPMSPHAAADIDEVSLGVSKIERPNTDNTLVIEGAGGLLVPINSKQTMIDLIKPQDKVVVVSRHYLGSINHTLLTIEALKNRGIDIFGLVFIGDEVPSTETAIEKLSKVRILGRIDQEPYIDSHVVSEYAERFKHIITT